MMYDIIQDTEAGDVVHMTVPYITCDVVEYLLQRPGVVWRWVQGNKCSLALYTITRDFTPIGPMKVSKNHSFIGTYDNNSGLYVLHPTTRYSLRELYMWWFHGSMYETNNTVLLSYRDPYEGVIKALPKTLASMKQDNTLDIHQG